MKKTRIFGLKAGSVAAVVAAFALAAGLLAGLAACNNGGGGGTPSGNGGDVAELRFTNEQVYTIGEDIVFTPYTGSTPVTNDQGGSGSISGGKLSFTIGEPTYLNPATDAFAWDLELSVTPGDARAARLILNNFALTKSDGAMTSPTSGWQENIEYYFVDMDCTVSIPAINEDGITGPAVTLRLNEGWNAVSEKITLAAGVMTYEIKVTAVTSGKWTIDED